MEIKTPKKQKLTTAQKEASYKTKANEIKARGNVMVGLDESGRGCAWGPLYVGLVIWPQGLADPPKHLKLTDSKKMDDNSRAIASKWIYDNIPPTHRIVLSATSAEVDGMNNSAAAMNYFHKGLSYLYQHREKNGMELIVMDGNTFTEWKPTEKSAAFPFVCCPKADFHFKQVSAASILAKHYRDSWVLNYASLNPHIDKYYGLSASKGYPRGSGSDQNIALEKYGLHEFHRKTWRTCIPFLEKKFDEELIKKDYFHEFPAKFEAFCEENPERAKELGFLKMKETKRTNTQIESQTSKKSKQEITTTIFEDDGLY